MLKQNYLILFILTQIIVTLKKITLAQSSCDFKCKVCSPESFCSICEDDFNYSESLNKCVSKCNDATYYYEPDKTCKRICPTNNYNDDTYNLCVEFQECANVQEYGQQYFDSITTTVQTPTSYIVAGVQNSNKPADYSLKIFSRDSIQLLGEMTLHKQQVIGLQQITDSSKVSYNSDSNYLISFSNTELVLWDLSRGIGMKYLTFDQLVTSLQSNKLVYYIDQDILIVFKSEVQFGVFFLENIKIYNDKDVISVQLVSIVHTKSMNGFVRNGQKLYSYSMDSTIVSYDLTAIKSQGDSVGAIVCTIPGNQILQSAQIFSTGEIALQLYQSLTYYYYNLKECKEINVGHTAFVFQMIKDEKQSTKYLFSLGQYKIIVSIADQDTVTPISSRQISKSFAFISQGYLILIDFSGFVVLNSFNNGILSENYSINLNWSKNFQITSAFIDLQYSQTILIGQGVIKLKFDPTNPFSTQMQLSSITQNVPTQQDQPTDKINGFLIDTLFNRLIVYSDDGSIRAYERINVFDNNYRQVIRKYHTSCNILDNSICQNKVIDLQLINQKLFVALYSDGSIIFWQYLFTDFQSLRMLSLDNPLYPAQTMNFNPNTNLLIFQSAIQLKVFNTTTSQIVGILNVNSTLVNFQYAYTEVFSSARHCIYVLDTKNRRLNLYLANNTKTFVSASTSYSSKKLYVSAKYFPTHRNAYVISDTNICYYSATLTRSCINQVGISGIISDGIIQSTLSLLKHLVFMNNLQVFSYSPLSTLNAQYTSATNVQDYSATYNKVNSVDVFAFFQNSGVSTIQNQVVIIVGTNLNFQHVLTFQPKISSILIDSVFSKLYIGFQNGQIYSGFIQTTFDIWLSSTAPTPIVPVGFYYSRAQNYFIYYRGEIRVTNAINYSQVAQIKLHTSNLIGFFYSDKSNTYLSCSSESNTNMFKLNLTNISTPQSTQFKTSTQTILSRCFLDDQNDIAIGYYTTTQSITYWSYINVTQIYTTLIHQQRAQKLKDSQVDIDPTLQISYQIQQIYIDTSIQRLIVVNNIQEVYMHNYATFVDTFISIPNMQSVYIDQQYKRLAIVIQQEFKQTFYSYSYSSDNIEFFKEFQFHSNTIRGIIFQKDKAYSYEDTFIVVMDRSTYEKLVTIQCVNPIITNFIIFEKLNLVIIWSDFNLGQFNQSIGIYNLLTGSKITDVVGYQSIETGNIHQIMVDEDSYQMIIAKNNPNNYFYTVDLRTFYYTGYYANRNYTTSILSMQLIPESNLLVYLDQSLIRIMSIETSMNSQYKFLSLTDSQNTEQFYNSEQKKLYFLDGLGVSWQLNANLKQLVYQIPFQGVRQTFFINQQFYVVSQNQILQYNQNFVNLGQIDQTSVNVTFSQDFVFIFNSNFQLYIADQDSFSSQYFYQFDSFFQQVIVNEKFQEIFVLQQTKKLNRFNIVTRDLLFNTTDANIDFLKIDSENNVIFQAYINGTLNIYPAYSDSIYDYMTGQPVQKLNFNQRIFKIQIDSAYNKFYVLLNTQIPLLLVYYYNVTNATLQNLTLITSFSLPSRSTQLKISTYQENIVLSLPWLIILIHRQTLNYIRVDRDNQIFYSQQKIIQVQNYQNLYIVQSSDKLAMYQLNQTYTQLFQFSLVYPKLASYSITNNSNSYNIQLIGISSGIAFSYNFVLPMVGQNSQPLFNINQCYQTMEDIEYGHQVFFNFRNYNQLGFVQKKVEQQMIILDKSSKILKYNLHCLTCSGASINIIKASSFILSSSYFLLNHADQGGALALIDLQYQVLLIMSNEFYNCTAQSHGGAIFSSSSDIMVNQTTIQFCSAQIGGALRYTGIEPLFIYYQKLYKLTQDAQYYIENNISQNQADIYGQNIGSYPIMVSVISNKQLEHKRVLFNNVDNFNIDQYSLQNFQSSAYINFQFQILDQELNPVRFDIMKFQKNQYPEIIQNEISNFNVKAIPGTDDVKIYGQYITDYSQFNKTDQTFKIEQMIVIADPGTSNYILFETPSIKMVLSPTFLGRKFDDGPFHVRLNMEFRECIRGEVYKLSGSIYYCQECKEGSYSIISPIQSEYENQICKRCPDEADYCYRDQMTLFPGYWKVDNNTDSIVKCSNKPENCYGSQETGYCIEGHIGPLCESCDVYGILWKRAYQSDGKFNCLRCQNLSSLTYIIPTILIALGIVFYMLISIRIILQINKLIVLGYYLRRLNLLPISKSSFQDTTNMNLKAMMSYMQISSMINTFVIKLPEWMTFIPDYLGSPVQNLQYSFDCILNQQQQSSYPIVFFRTIWFLAIPFIYLGAIGLLYSILVLFRISKFDKSYIISGLVFLSFFIQPNMISNILGVMSCRSIDQKLYIQSDISYECYTEIHLKYIAIVCLPGLFIWAFIIPLVILRNLIKSKRNLEDANIRLKYGFLYQDYKNEHFYWEFVRIYTKMIVVAVLSFYGDPYTNKLVIILCLFLIYQVALIKFQPYQMKYFQQLDKTSMIVFIILLIMNIFLYNKPDVVQSQMFYVVLLLIHNGYQFFLLIEVVRAKLSIKYKDIYNKIVLTIIKLMPFMKKFLAIKKKIPFNTFRLWMKVKFFLNECSERKIYNEQNSPQFGKSSDLNPEQIYFQPSKRNRNRMFNQNLQLASSRNIAISNRNIVKSEDLSKNLPLLSKDMNLLSIDSNNIQLLSPKGVSSASQLQSNNVDSMHQYFQNPYSDVIAKRLPYTQLLRSLFNYADVEEEEDFRRIQKKASINQEYRLYQKIDLIYKNLKQVEVEDNYTPTNQQSKQDIQNPNIEDSILEINQPKIKRQKKAQVYKFFNFFLKNRQAQVLSPRFITNVDNLDQSIQNEQEVKHDSQGEVIELSEQSQNNQVMQPGQNRRYVYLQNEEKIFDQFKERKDNIVKSNQVLNLDEQIQKSVKDEDEEDNRRLIKKSQFQYDLNLKRKTNLIYKNLFLVAYNEKEIAELKKKNQALIIQDNINNNDMIYNIEDSLVSLNDSNSDQKQNRIYLNQQIEILFKQSDGIIEKQLPKKDSFKNILDQTQTNQFDNNEQIPADQGRGIEVDQVEFQMDLGSIENQTINQQTNLQEKENIFEDQILEDQQQFQNLYGQIQNTYVNQQVNTQTDISTSKQIQNIIDNFAQNLQIKENLEQSDANYYFQQNSETPQHTNTIQQDKKYYPPSDIIEEEENIKYDEAESESSAKDNMTQVSLQKANSYFKGQIDPNKIENQGGLSNANISENFFDSKSNFEIKSQRKQQSQQFRQENESIIQDHNDDQTLFKDYGKLISIGGLTNAFEGLKVSLMDTPIGDIQIKQVKEGIIQFKTLEQSNQFESINDDEQKL